MQNPLPVVEGTQVQRASGVEIRGHGVSPSAVQASASFINQMIGSRTDVQGRMAAARVVVVIVPRGSRMTDLPEFQSLAGQRTFDGRPWDQVRGSGGILTPEGVFAIAVPEENLVQAGPDSYGEFNVGMHEFAHSLHSRGLAQQDQRRITSLYTARQTAGGPWTEAYGASNEQEYFAQATNCFFRQNGTVGQNSPEWLRENDRPMYDFLVGLYGAPAGPTSSATGPGATGAGTGTTTGTTAPRPATGSTAARSGG